MTDGFLAESGSRMQGVNMSARMTFLAAVLLIASIASAAAACGPAIAEFEGIIDSDVATGNLAKRVHARMVSELASIKAACAAGRDAEATRGLAAIKSRHGYR